MVFLCLDASPTRFVGYKLICLYCCIYIYIERTARPEVQTRQSALQGNRQLWLEGEQWQPPIADRPRVAVQRPAPAVLRHASCLLWPEVLQRQALSITTSRAKPSAAVCRHGCRQLRPESQQRHYGFMRCIYIEIVIIMC